MIQILTLIVLIRIKSFILVKNIVYTKQNIINLFTEMNIETKHFDWSLFVYIV